ncbi:DUF3558 family protein [Qaidamihabitans albus]|uniref:DUF3558 family protein n=1 Tax=Qaidamihabitans albus TaxID=2795733 RepID=UPI0018F245D8|nr:DUF3558 family protein [Qaidamihabitans albus]
MRGNVLGLLAVCLLLAACGTTVGGTAQPVAAPTTSASGVESGEPCALLTPEEATHLELRPEGEFTPGEPANLLPPNCYWGPAETAEGVDSLTVSLATGMSVAEYVDGVEPVETGEFGGLTWSRYLDPVGGESMCLLVTELSETSFVAVSSMNVTEEAKACDLAKKGAPFVAGHLPGGAPAEVPTSTAPEPSALASIDPCTLLTPEEAEQLGRSGSAKPLDGTGDGPPGCQWDDTDGDAGEKALDLYAGDRPAEEWYYYEDEGEPLEVGGFTWKVQPGAGGYESVCQAIMSFTDTSSVYITSGNLDDPAKMCDTLRAAIPLITAHLPEP